MRDEGWRLEINLVELSGSGRSPRDPPTTPCAHMGPVKGGYDGQNGYISKIQERVRAADNWIVRKTVHFVSIMFSVSWRRRSRSLNSNSQREVPLIHCKFDD